MGFWSKVKKAAKKVGKAIKKGAEAVVDAVSTVVNGVVETVESVVGWVGSAVSFIIGVILSIPIILFIVRSFKDGKLGCSLGPLVDYVTASGAGIKRDDSIIAHECAHACGLWHQDSLDNLLFPDAGRGTNLKRWQVAILRNSRHVTYF